MKLLGPKSEAFRQSVVTHQPDISADESLVLNYALSDKIPSNIATSFIKKVAKLYGSGIPYPTVRNACLAIAVRFLYPISFESKSEHYKLEATKALSHKLGCPAEIGESDIFGSLLLAQLAIMENLPGSEVLIHLQGCMSMLTYVSNNRRGSISAEMLQHFDFLILDIADYIEPLISLHWITTLDRLAIGRRSVFARRVEFFELIPGALPSSHLAVIYTLAFLLRSSVAVIRHMARIQESPGWLINGILSIKSQIQDFDFLIALDELCQPEAQINATDHLFPLQCLTCIRLLIAIFSASSILQGTASSDSVHCAKIIVSHYRSLSVTNPQLLSVPEASNISQADILVCGGICLPYLESPHRK
jgi:hypothetical protein